MSCDPVLDDPSLVAGDPVVRLHADLAATARAASQARALVASALANRTPSLPVEVVSTAQLLTSELVTNAILHARTDLHLGIAHDGHALLIAVADGRPDIPPGRKLADIDFEESGRGMTVVASIADDFGWRSRYDAPGKIMWALLALTGSPRPLRLRTQGA